MGREMCVSAGRVVAAEQGGAPARQFGPAPARTGPFRFWRRWRSAAAGRNTGGHHRHPQHTHLVPSQRTPVPCRRGRRTDMRLRPHRGLVARPLASPLRGRRADLRIKQLTHQQASTRRATAPTTRSPASPKSCAATLCNRRTRDKPLARAICLPGARVLAGLRLPGGLTDRLTWLPDRDV